MLYKTCMLEQKGENKVPPDPFATARFNHLAALEIYFNDHRCCLSGPVQVCRVSCQVCLQSTLVA